MFIYLKKIICCQGKYRTVLSLIMMNLNFTE
jgi:hypothetical protein